MVRDISDTSVQLSWSRGFDNHSPIAKYTLQARTLPSGKWKQVRTSKCEVLPRSVLVSLVVQDLLQKKENITLFTLPLTKSSHGPKCVT